MLQSFNEKNANIKVWVKDRLVSRDDAKVSVFDSVVQGGDAVWEGLRVYKGGIFVLERHLDRLMASAKAMHFQNIPERQIIIGAIMETLKANSMFDDVHIRLTLTRGEKITSGMDPRLNTKGCTLIVLAEWKPPVYDNNQGINVITASTRRNAASHLDSKIHHNNLINNILAKIEANIAGADAALMLDVNGFASELNGTNIFMVKNSVLYTPHADACLPGITRGLVMELAAELKIKLVEKNISLTEFYNADEVFCTGTMGELTPINKIDGRLIENNNTSLIMQSLIQAFDLKIQAYSTKII
jgi:branched-chain amino acid aminotransferase